MKQSEVKGHCQRCGHVQVAHQAQMALHGYTVRSGYFSGVCQGHQHAPLELERSYLDWIVEDLRRYALAHQMGAERLQSGADLPEQVFKRNAWEGIEYQKQVSWKVPAKPVMVNWHDASEVEQRLGLQLAIDEHLSEARFARSHADGLVKLAARVHGQPLINRDAEELQKRQARAAKKAPIPGAFRTKAAQKDALEALNRQYDKLRRLVCNSTPAREGAFDGGVQAEKIEKVWDLPFDLHNFRPRHAAAIRDLMPELEGAVLEMERLAAERANVKAMAIIK